MLVAFELLRSDGQNVEIDLHDRAQSVDRIKWYWSIELRYDWVVSRKQKTAAVGRVTSKPFAFVDLNLNVWTTGSDWQSGTTRKFGCEGIYHIFDTGLSTVTRSKSAGGPMQLEMGNEVCFRILKDFW